VQNDPRHERATAGALAALAAAIRETVDDLQRLGDRAVALREQLGAMPLTEAMEAEERPLIITKLVEITDRLHEVGGVVRRTEAQQLRAEGRTHEQIAELFGVTRQRVSQLLDSPAVKRPSKRAR